jgi:superfamily I DNA and/or RNA helicase
VEGREEAADSKGGKRAAMERAASESAVGTSSGASYRNMAEARATLDVAAALLAAGDISSCAILAPYKGQVRALEQLVRAAGPGLVPAGCELVVSSVDGYQGREADVVVFSTVR